MNISTYFNSLVMPLIQSRHPHIAEQMSIMILGSVGLLIDDHLSDMEAAIYLEEPLWKEHGKQLQLDLNELMEKTNPWQKKGSIICVHPTSWLLDGQVNAFFSQKTDKAWNRVTMESLFTMQENMIYYDPQGTLTRLRQMTAASKYPEELWKKSLITALLKLVYEDFPELKLAVLRNHFTETYVVMGHVMQELMQIPFLMIRQYYPWRSHLRWAFDRNAILASNFGREFDAILSCNDWHDKIAMIERTIETFRKYILDNHILPEINIMCQELDKELLWAQRLNAWKNPDWKEKIAALSEEAKDHGYPDSEFWVFSLWG